MNFVEGILLRLISAEDKLLISLIIVKEKIAKNWINKCKNSLRSQFLKIKKLNIETNEGWQVNNEELKALLSQLWEAVDDAVIDEMIKIADLYKNGKLDINKFFMAVTERFYK